MNSPLKSTRGRFTTPEFLATVTGGFLILQGLGELSLHADRLVFAFGWERTEIPFLQIREICLARTPRWTNPGEHAFLLIGFVEDGKNRRLLFRRGDSLFQFAGTSHDAAAEWVTAIRGAMGPVPASKLSGEPDALIVMPASPWGAWVVILPVLLFALINLIGGTRALSGGAGSILILAPLLIVLLLPLGFLGVSRLFGKRGAKDAALRSRQMTLAILAIITVTLLLMGFLVRNLKTSQQLPITAAPVRAPEPIRMP